MLVHRLSHHHFITIFFIYKKINVCSVIIICLIVCNDVCSLLIFYHFIFYINIVSDADCQYIHVYLQNISLNVKKEGCKHPYYLCVSLNPHHMNRKILV